MSPPPFSDQVLANRYLLSLLQRMSQQGLLLPFAGTVSLVGHSGSRSPHIKSVTFAGQWDTMTEIANTSQSFIPLVKYPLGNWQLVFPTKGQTLFFWTHSCAVFLNLE